LTIPGAVVILAGSAASGRGVPAVVGAAALFGVYLVVHVLAPAAMGAGDVKLAAGIGGLTGAFGVDVWAVSAVAAALLTAGAAVAVLLRGTGSTVPHGPSMCLAAAATCVLALV
jgi:leader peptidase (prepilin peptidase)/N-methyltransferase